MPNLRIIYNNLADTSTISASSTSGSLVASNMLIEDKGTIHRSTGTSVTYTLTWATPQSIGGISLPATNLSATATITATLYSDVACTSVLTSIGPVYACPGATLELWNWALPLNANAFAFGGASKSTVWFANQQGNVKGLKITLVDSLNTFGQIDCARIVCGEYWEPRHTVQNGSLSIELADMSTTERADSGTLLASRSIVYDKLRFDMSYLEETDRQQFMRFVRLTGKSRNILITIFPDNTNSVLAQDTTIYGKIVAGLVQNQQFFGYYAMPLEIEGW